MNTFHYDQSEIKKTSKTEEGFLRADSIITKTGVFPYINKDGTIRKELRHPDHVFNKDSIDSMNLIPITKMHPTEKIVTSENSKFLKVGSTGESSRRDGDFLRNSIVVNDQDAIDGVESGKIQELSLGYTLDLVPEKGVYNGDAYDHIQTNIRYNHLALVPSARAGAEARIALDSNDFMIHNLDDSNSGGDKKKPKQETRKMETIRTDNGLSYDAAPEVAAFVVRETSRADTAEAEIKDLTGKKDTVQANLDEANAKIKKLEDVNHDEEINKRVQSRLKLEKSATERLDEKERENLDSMSDKDIQIAIIKKSDPEFNSDERSDEYMTARFDGAISAKPEMKSSDKQKPSVNKDGKKFNEDSRTSEESRNDMIEREKNAWKGEQK